MSTRHLLLIFVSLLFVSLANRDEITISSIKLTADSDINCTQIILQINSKNIDTDCYSVSGNAKQAVFIPKNITQVTTATANLNITANLTSTGDIYHGVLESSKASENKITTIASNLTAEAKPAVSTTIATTPAATTTPATTPNTTTPSTTVATTPTTLRPSPIPKILLATVEVVRIKDVPATTVNNNGGAVAVAVIEGLGLLAILAWWGYKHFTKNQSMSSGMGRSPNIPNNGYELDIPRRTGVTNDVRMSEIRDPYAQQNSYQQNNSWNAPRPQVSSPDLVPVTGRTNPVAPQSIQQQPTSTTTTGQFSDPFSSLDQW